MANLIMQFNNYRGTCDNCGEEITADLLLACEQDFKDRYGNRVFYIIGIPDECGSAKGRHLVCSACGCRVTFLRFYEPIDVTEAIKVEAAL